MQLKARIIFFCGAVTLAVLIALLLVYLFGAFYQHERYWEGTIHRIQQNQAQLISAFIANSNALEEDNINEKLPALFDVMRGKLLIEVSKNGSIIYRNGYKNKLGGLIYLNTKKNNLEITVKGYKPPKWSHQFSRWIKNMGRWFEPSFNFITFPYLFFFGMSFISIYALGLKNRVNYLSQDVLKVINDIEGYTK